MFRPGQGDFVSQFLSGESILAERTESSYSASTLHFYSINAMPVAIPESFDAMQTLFRMMLENSAKHIISFVNPEIFLTAETNPFMLWYLQQTDYNFVDGNGLLLAINKMQGTHFSANDRYTGTDFFTYLPADRTTRIFLYGASEENNMNAAEKIHADFPNVEICGRVNGYEQKSDDEIISLINESNADILIVCLGCPRQECWILKNKDRLNAKIIFGNGGAIDFWSGSVKRAPEFMIRHRLEWLYRLGQDFSFKRIRRQMRLVPFAMRIARGGFVVGER